MRIRPALSSDIPAVAAIKVESWRHAYRSIVPDAVLDALTPAEAQAQWLGVAPSDFASFVLVAEGPGGVAGYTISGPVREPAGGFAAQLYAIYLRPSHMRMGVGTALFHTTAQRLAARIRRIPTLGVRGERAGARVLRSPRGHAHSGR
jgi:ribosomal protein S18 acetylase RimI-like enzyme